MNHEYRLADIGEGLEEAEIVNWLVQIGDRVERDQPLIEVMTDKSNAELPSPVSGTVVGLHGSVGDIVHVGGLIATIRENEAADPAAPPAPPAPERSASQPAMDTPAPGSAAHVAAQTPVPSVQPPPANVQAAPQTESTPQYARPKASPSTRRAAARLGVDLTTVVGSGPGGRILLADLDTTASTLTSAGGEPASPKASAVVSPPLATPALSEPAAPSPDAAKSPQPTTGTSATPAEPRVGTTAASVDAANLASGTIPLRGIRRVVAQNMARSWAEIPHIHAFEHIDAEPLLEMRRRLKETSKAEYEHLTPLAFFVAAVSKALAAFPDANRSIDMSANTITQHPDVHVGVAVAAPQGLVVPVLRNAGSLEFPALTSALSELISGARASSLPTEAYRGGTVTITNFGSLGGEQAIPIIRAPEAMIFGFGSIADRPFVVEDEVVPRKTLNLVAGADHRLLDGDITTSVLGDVAASLTDPLRLVL